MRQVHECAKIMLTWLKITRLINVLKIIKHPKYKLTWAVFGFLPTELDSFLLLGYWLEVNRTDNISHWIKQWSRRLFFKGTDSGNPIYSILDVLRNYITLLITKRRWMNHKAEVFISYVLNFKCYCAME